MPQISSPMLQAPLFLAEIQICTCIQSWLSSNPWTSYLSVPRKLRMGTLPPHLPSLLPTSLTTGYRKIWTCFIFYPCYHLSFPAIHLVTGKCSQGFCGTESRNRVQSKRFSGNAYFGTQIWLFSAGGVSDGLWLCLCGHWPSMWHPVHHSGPRREGRTCYDWYPQVSILTTPDPERYSGGQGDCFV